MRNVLNFYLFSRTFIAPCEKICFPSEKAENGVEHLKHTNQQNSDVDWRKNRRREETANCVSEFGGYVLGDEDYTVW